MSMRLAGSVMASAVVLVACSVSTVAEELHGNAWFVTVPHLNLKTNDRVGGFRLTVMAGWVEAIPHVPADWSVAVDCSPSWKCTFSGQAGHGVGALMGDTKFFDRFVRVEEWPSIPGVALPEFDVEVEVTVFEMPDLGTKVRTLKLDMRDLVLEPAPSRGEASIAP